LYNKYGDPQSLLLHWLATGEKTVPVEKSPIPGSFNRAKCLESETNTNNVKLKNELGLTDI
jgi:hypothetical protein